MYTKSTITLLQINFARQESNQSVNRSEGRRDQGPVRQLGARELTVSHRLNRGDFVRRLLKRSTPIH